MARDAELDPVLIDDARLDQECRDQPRRVRDCGNRVAEADFRLGKLKAKFKLVEAQLTTGVYQTPSEFGLEGPPKNADVAKSLVVQHDDYQSAQRAFLEQEAECAVVKAEQAALRDRKGMLECMVQLHLTDYRSEPRVPAVSRRDVEDKARRRAGGDVIRKKKKK